MDVRPLRFRSRRRSAMARTLAAALVAVTLTGVPGQDAPIALASAWSSEQQLSDGSQTAADLVSALADDGTTAVAAWRRSDGSDFRIEVAIASIGVEGAAWSTPVPISPAGGSAQRPAVAISADGSTVLVVWDRVDIDRTRIQAVVGTITNGVAAWASVVDLSAAGFNANFVDAALHDDGSLALVTWLRYDGSHFRVQTVTGTISGGAVNWGTPSFVSPAGATAFRPDAAMARDGGTVGAVWESSSRVSAATATTSGLATSFGTAETLSDATRNAIDPTLDIENGVAIAAWRRTNGPNWILQMRSATIGAVTPTWEPVVNLSESGQDASYPTVVMDADASTSVVAWTRSNGSHAIVQVRVATLSAASTTWSSPTDLSASGHSARYTKAALAANGNRAAVIWDRPDDSGFRRVQMSVADIAGGEASWGVPRDLSSHGENASQPLISLSADGRIALAVWSVDVGGVSLVRSRVLDLLRFTVTFDANGGAGSMSSQSSTVSASLSPNTFTFPGYTFTGWNTAANGWGMNYDDAGWFPFASDTTLYAQWQLVPLPQLPLITAPVATTTTEPQSSVPPTTVPATGNTQPAATPPTPATNASGELPQLEPGALQVVEGDAEIRPEVVVERASTLVVRSLDFAVRLSGQCPSGCEGISDEAGRSIVLLESDGTVRLEGSGYEPGSLVHGWVFSEPRYLGALPVRADGTFDGSLQLAGLVAGTHTLQLQGTASDGRPRTVNLGVVVQSAAIPAPISTSLPATGMSWTAITLLAWLVVLLGMVVLTVRRVPVAGRTIARR